MFMSMLLSRALLSISLSEMYKTKAIAPAINEIPAVATTRSLFIVSMYEMVNSDCLS